MTFRHPEYDTVIVGGGVIGLYTAYHLARKMDPRRIVVVDRGFLSQGASGRNGGGVRQQWETAPTVRLAREAVRAYRGFGRSFGYNPWFRQGGYLFLAFSEEEGERLRRVESVVRSEGLPLERLGEREAHRLVPALDLTGLAAANYLASDGVIHPFPVLWGLADSLERQGVELHYHTEVMGIESASLSSAGTSPGKVSAVVTREGRLSTSRVVNAAGGWSKEVSRLAGLDSPNRPTLHEILATEPLKPFLDPMVVTTRRGLYISQTMRGEIVGGLTMEDPPVFPAMPSSIDFLKEMSRELVRLVPALAGVRILRAWAGHYDETPDNFPVIGEDPRLTGFFHANGFGGHGFMLAPAATRLLADEIFAQKALAEGQPFSPARFLGERVGEAVEKLKLG